MRACSRAGLLLLLRRNIQEPRAKRSLLGADGKTGCPFSCLRSLDSGAGGRKNVPGRMMQCLDAKQELDAAVCLCAAAQIRVLRPPDAHLHVSALPAARQDCWLHAQRRHHQPRLLPRGVHRRERHHRIARTPWQGRYRAGAPQLMPCFPIIFVGLWGCGSSRVADQNILCGSSTSIDKVKMLQCYIC